MLTFGFFFPTLNPPLSRGHFESSLPPFSLFSLLSPLNENHVHFTHFELPTGASPYSTFLNCYTQILQNLIFLNICLSAVSWSFHLNHFIFFIYLFILFFIIFLIYFIHWPLVLLLFCLNVEQLWQHCLIILYDLTTAIYFTLWVFHLFNKWPTTCNALICAIGSLWCFSLIWSSQRGNNSRRSVTQTRLLTHFSWLTVQCMVLPCRNATDFDF